MAIEDHFPNLKSSGYQITSPETPEYNCVAWAAAEDDRWWWPDPLGVAYWPRGAVRLVAVAAFVEAFRTLGYEPCDDSNLETGVEKVAIYAGREGKPTHVARQLLSGKWTSKLGKSEDIEHTSEGLDSQAYGAVAQILRRPTE